MTATDRTERVTRRNAIMSELLREKGVLRYGLFAVTTEGRLLPDGSESASGFVIDAKGQVFSFWLDWDDRQGRIVFTEFSHVEAEADWEDDEEYLQARAAVGLDS